MSQKAKEGITSMKNEKTQLYEVMSNKMTEKMRVRWSNVEATLVE